MPKQPTDKDPAAIRAELLEALHRRSYLRVRRRPTYADDLDGFVVGVGAKWALLQCTRDGGYLEGWLAVRLVDIRRIRNLADSFQSRVAARQPSWPPAPPLRVDLDRTGEMLQSLAAERLVGIEKERERSALWIGTVEGIELGHVWLHEIDPQARWHDRPLAYRLGAITCVQVRTEYLNGLVSVAPERVRS